MNMATIVTLVVVLALAAFAVAFAEDIPVPSTEVEPGVWVGDVVALTNALKTCKAGDTIILAKGTYGPVYPPVAPKPPVPGFGGPSAAGRSEYDL